MSPLRFPPPALSQRNTDTPVVQRTRPEAMKMGISTVTSTEADVMFQAVPRQV